MNCSNITAITAVAAVAAVAAIGALAISTPASAQLVNGSFELPASNGSNQIIPGGDSTSITGWTTLAWERYVGFPTLPFSRGAASEKVLPSP